MFDNNNDQRSEDNHVTAQFFGVFDSNEERLSGFRANHFDMYYFEGRIMAGFMNQAEEYLLGFTYVGDNVYSDVIICQLKMLKFLDALDRGNMELAKDIVMKELAPFASTLNFPTYQQAVKLLEMDNFRFTEHRNIIKDARKNAMDLLKRMVRVNPVF